jgi:hypothetical protein
VLRVDRATALGIFKSLFQRAAFVGYPHVTFAVNTP